MVLAGEETQRDLAGQGCRRRAARLERDEHWWPGFRGSPGASPRAHSRAARREGREGFLEARRWSSPRRAAACRLWTNPLCPSGQVEAGRGRGAPEGAGPRGGPAPRGWDLGPEAQSRPLRLSLVSSLVLPGQEGSSSPGPLLGTGQAQQRMPRRGFCPRRWLTVALPP